MGQKKEPRRDAVLAAMTYAPAGRGAGSILATVAQHLGLLVVLWRIALQGCNATVNLKSQLSGVRSRTGPASMRCILDVLSCLQPLNAEFQSSAIGSRRSVDDGMYNLSRYDRQGATANFTGQRSDLHATAERSL
jgi:hypothetical protein